ncbi:MAG: hypothetical protein OEW31_10625 [Thermoleophilia bacterium]|nr:hypothetical protein [Thermoleophilia bacterium]MDH4346777.1 hypothetical protein [Thermoleophilia bacterium]
MELELRPRAAEAVAAAVRRAITAEGLAERPLPDAYGSPWLRAARAEGVDGRLGRPTRYARSPRSMLGATRA